MSAAVRARVAGVIMMRFRTLWQAQRVSTSSTSEDSSTSESSFATEQLHPRGGELDGGARCVRIRPGVVEGAVPQQHIPGDSFVQRQGHLFLLLDPVDDEQDAVRVLGLRGR